MLDKLLLRLRICHHFLYFVAKRNIASSHILRKRIFAYPKLVCNEIQKLPADEELTREEKLINSLKDKLVYNSLVTSKNSVIRWHLREMKIHELSARKMVKPRPLSLQWVYDLKDSQYLLETEGLSEAVKGEYEQDQNNAEITFPYNIVKEVDIQSDTSLISDNENGTTKSVEPDSEIQLPKNAKRWWYDYEVYEEELINEDKIEMSDVDFGTPNSKVLPSNVPCGGCGANLHCQDSSIPGYLPTELFMKYSDNDLRSVICQRCTFLKNYNIALSVNVDPDCYPKLLSKLKEKNVLIVLLVDMTDYPCSIWPKLFDVVGADKPIVLVGNKIDLIPGDSRGWLAHAQKMLRESFPARANVIHTELVSAKTDYGIESLITKLHSLWSTRGDIYIVGCTNVGKSSLFNKLLQSDFCQSRATDLIQRATTAPWPGTTLNLLRFPILKLDAWKSYLRNNRLLEERRMLKQERYLEKLQAEDAQVHLSDLPKIDGIVGRTFNYRNANKVNEDWVKNPFSMPTLTNKILKEVDKKPTLDPNAPEFKSSKWCYDTPGVVHPDQIINLLTTEELNKIIPKKAFEPRFFSIYPEQSIFIGGLARIDLVHTDRKFVRMVIYASADLPITLCQTAYCDEVYRTLLGTKFLAVPHGSSSRLKRWPQLKSTQEFEFVGMGNANTIADVVLSSAGWISPFTDYGAKFVLRPFTPEGRGIHLRKKPLLRFTALRRRGRIHNTPTYRMSHHISK